MPLLVQPIRPFHTKSLPKFFSLSLHALSTSPRFPSEELQPYVLPVVRKAEKLIFDKNENKEYLPIEGLAAFRKATVDLLLGAKHPAIAEGRVAVIQSLSGTGSLRVGAAFIARWMPNATVYISDPTWGNHFNIFGDEKVKTAKYRYFKKETIGLDFEVRFSITTTVLDSFMFSRFGPLNFHKFFPREFLCLCSF